MDLPPAMKTVSGRPGRPGGYRQVLRPAGPLHLFEQQSEFTVQPPPTGVQGQDGDPTQFESAQSMAVSQSLSMPSLQISVDGTQVVPR